MKLYMHYVYVYYVCRVLKRGRITDSEVYRRDYVQTKKYYMMVRVLTVYAKFSPPGP